MADVKNKFSKTSKDQQGAVPEKVETTWFQYHKGHDIPVYIALEETPSQDLINFLGRMQFSKITSKEVQMDAKGVRILHMSICTPLVARQIDAPMESDRFGMESLVHREGHRIYRYRGEALVLFSFTSRDWRMGHFPEFGTSAKEHVSRHIMNRFLAWALAPLGIIGLWGVPVDDGLVCMRPSHSEGEAVFVDVMGRRILTVDSVKRMGPRFKVLRLDPTLHGKNVRMSQEELLTLLMHHSAYFDIQGPSVPVRQMIQEIARQYEGLFHPRESFRPRSGLPLRA